MAHNDQPPSQKETTTVRLSYDSLRRLKALKPFDGVTHPEMIAMALDAYEERLAARYNITTDELRQEMNYAVESGGDE